MFSIWKRMANSHCYKIMFAIGVIDMATILDAGFLTGYLGYFGYVFCSSPKFIYFVGVYGFCKKLLFWLGIPILYGLSIITWSEPVIFTGIYFSWFLNPHIGYIDDVNHEYENTLLAFHNPLIIFFLLITYLTFFIIFVIKSKHGEFESSQQSYSEIMVFYIKYSHNPKFQIFLQIFLISLFNSGAAFIYVYMQYIHINEVVIIIGQICWLNAHGGKYFLYNTSN
ncbi:unnamed protein product [Meloidogyne enterolobii]|uniref:Uncharacterized protein n=2 Tax=Meloidogyne enterolobii TaxID=390850 RepID=A0ACB0YZA2_MELEN